MAKRLAFGPIDVIMRAMTSLMQWLILACLKFVILTSTGFWFESKLLGFKFFHE